MRPLVIGSVADPVADPDMEFYLLFPEVHSSTTAVVVFWRFSQRHQLDNLFNYMLSIYSKIRSDSDRPESGDVGCAILTRSTYPPSKPFRYSRFKLTGSYNLAQYSRLRGLPD